jgi:uncharacterized protein (TIGR02466 family)
MFQNKKTIPLFPTTVWAFKIPAEAADRIKRDITAKMDELVAAAPRTNNTFLQTEHDFHTLAEMQELMGYFTEAVGEVIGALAPKYKELEITGCWANVHPANSLHRAHSHPNNFLSAVYYVTVPPEGNQIAFFDPRMQHYILTPAVAQSNAYNSEHLFFEVEEGMLILFPSWLVHSVPAGEGSASRVSIAFNLNFKDFCARISPPNWVPNVPTHPKAP